MKMLITIILSILSLTSLAQSITTREVTKIPHFDRVVLASGINMTIVKSNKPKITIKGERSVILQVVCQVTEGELSIYTTKFKYKKTKRIDIVLEVDSALTSIVGSSGNKIRCETAIPCQSLTLNGRYGCDFFFNVKADYLKVKASTGSDIRLVGNVRKSDMFAENASTIRAFKLTSYSTFVAVNASSKVDVMATDVIDVSSTDDCIVRYKGDPDTKQINAIGNSQVHAVKDDAI